MANSRRGWSLDLLPPPKRVRFTGGKSTSRKKEFVLRGIGKSSPEAYRLTIDKLVIRLESSTAQGHFYAEQTLAQLISQFGKSLPCVEITDWPDYPVRGFYHDVSRGKVPKLSTLIALAEKCAYYKLNHLELYIEHTYAYALHPEVWRGADPLTREEILKLDARCAELHIDLVPSFSTFGHFYTWIHDKFPELNELEHDVSGDPFCWWDRMMHYTLDCANPRSIALVREIVREVRPLFRSKCFNICADETFDLGRGRNRKRAEKIGKGRLYVDFLKKIMAEVRRVKAIPLFWGDVIGHYPQLLSEIPEDAIALDWDYSPKLTESKAALMQQAGRAFYICSGVSGWNCWLPDFHSAHENITRFARRGLARGAIGMLNTDWGDFGHINSLGPTLPGLALGAAAGWNARSRELREDRFQAVASRTILGDPTGKLLGLLTRCISARRAGWAMICWVHQPRSRDHADDWFHQPSGLPNDLFAHPGNRHVVALKTVISLTSKIEKLLRRCRPMDELVIEEIRVGLLGLRAMEELHLVYHHRAGKCKTLAVRPATVAEHLRELARRLAVVWKKRNKPSEFHRIRDVLLRAARDMENGPP